MSSGKVRVINILSDEVHGVFAYTIQDPKTLKLKRISYESLVAGLEYIENAYKLPSGEVDIQGAENVPCGRDYTKFSGALKKGFNDFETFCRLRGREDLLEEYDYAKNQKSIDSISANAIDKVWWKCKRCGFEWATPIKSRTGLHTGCTRCLAIAGKGVQLFKGINDLETWCKGHNREDILASIAPDSPVKPGEISAKNFDTKLKFRCNVCGREYWQTPGSRVKTRGCPYCSKVGTSFPELVLYYAMSELFSNVHHKYRFTYEGRSMEIDIYIVDLNLAIEFDGEYWHSMPGVGEREQHKDEACQVYGVTLLRVKEDTSLKATGTPEFIEPNIITSNPGGSRMDLVLSLVLGWINSRYNTNYTLTTTQLELIINTAKASINSRIVPNSVAEVAPEVAERWDYERNMGLRPENVSRGCKYKAWFKCPDCGNSYYSFIRKQVDGQRCPICAGQKVAAGYNDFETNAPHAMLFWDYSKNNQLGIYPNMISKKSNKNVHWMCPDCGLELFESPRTFASRHYCVGCGKPIRGDTNGGEYQTDWEKKRASNPKSVRRFRTAKGLCSTRAMPQPPAGKPYK